MEKKKNIFIKIDEFIFLKLDYLKTDSNFQKFNEILSGFEEKQQKLFAQILTFSLILIPYLFVVTLWWGNHKAKNNLAIKNQILEQISILNGNRETKAFISSTYLSPVAILGKDDLENKIRNLMSASNIEQTKVRVINFTQLSSSSSISKVEATLSFQNFGTVDFSNFMHALAEKDKFKVIRIKLAKNKTSGLLAGDVTVIHLGKNSPF